MAFKVEELMTKIVPGAGPGPRLRACPDDSHGNCPGECPDDSHGNCPDDSHDPCRGHSNGPCPDDSRDERECPDDSRDQCPDDSNSPTHGTTRPPHHGRAGGHGSEALALLQRQLRERLDSAPEARI